MLETCLRSMPREQSPHLVWPTCAAHFQAILNEHASAKDIVRLHSRKRAVTQRVSQSISLRSHCRVKSTRGSWSSRGGIGKQAP